MVEKARWIASYPKSGNTWVRCFIDAYVTGTLNINHLRITQSDVNDFDYQRCADIPLGKMMPFDTIWYRNAALFNAIVRRPVIFKTHMANVEVQGIKVIPPELTKSAIYLVRDPRAVCVSLALHNNKQVNEIIHQMNEARTLLKHDTPVGHFPSSWSDNVETWEKAEFPVLRVRYEDLKDDQEYWFAEILKMLGYSVNKRKLIKAIKMCELSKLKAQEDKEGFKEKLHQHKFFGNSKDWKDILDETQIKMIEIVHHEYMVKLGYMEKEDGKLCKVQPGCGSVRTGSKPEYRHNRSDVILDYDPCGNRHCSWSGLR